MNASAFLDTLTARGMAVKNNGGMIAVKPISLLTAEDRETMAAVKPAIIAHLGAPSLAVGSRVEVEVEGQWYLAAVVSVWGDDDGAHVYTIPERRGWVEVCRDDAFAAPDGSRTHTLVPPTGVRLLGKGGGCIPS